MSVKIHNIQQSTPEWLKLRENKVTGSNAHILLSKGLDEAIKANSVVIKKNYWMERGLILEDEAIEIYEAIREVDVLRVGFVTNTQYPNAGASPDGIVGNTLIEVKAFTASKMLGINEQNIPFQVMAQLQFNMMICELESADLVLYNPDLPAKDAFRIIQVFRDFKIAENIERCLLK